MADSSLDLSINIGANTQDFANQLQKAENLLGQFQAALKKSTNVGEINYLNTQINNLNTTIDTLKVKMSGISKPSGDATNALTNLSRVAQDAPYGFMGIANNINPLLESFQRLVKESGGVGNALKSMASGLMGPAGIGLAVGAATSLIVAFGDEIIEMFASVSESDKAFAKLRDAFEENLKSVGTTIATDQALIAVINDVNQSTEARNAALKKLKEEHKGYDDLQKATINDTDALRAMTDRLSDALVRKAKTEAIAKIIGEEYAKQVRLQTASVGEQINNLSAIDKVYSVWKGTLTSFGVTNAANTAIENAKGPALKKNTQDIQQTTDALEKLDKKYKELTSEQYQKGDFDLLGNAGAKPKTAKTKEQVDTSDLETLKKKQQLYKEDVYLFKEYADLITKEEERIALEKARINKASANEIQNIKDQAAIGLQQNAINLGNSLDKIFKAADDKYIKDQKEFEKEKLANQLQASKDGLEIVKNSLEIETKLAGDSYEKKKEALQKAMAETKILMALSSNPKAVQELDKAYKDLNKQYKLLDFDEKQKDLKNITKQTEKYAEVIASTLTDGFMTMFDAMQKGENPLQALGNYVGDLVKKLAEAAIQAAIFQGIMMLLSPATAGGFGEGFIGGFKKILGFAEGGVVSQPTLAMVGEGGQSEAIMPLNKLSNMLGSTFNAGAMSGAGAGSGNGQFVLKGNDLVLALQRSNYSLNLRRGNGI